MNNKCFHVWIPKIIFSPLLYIRECQSCGLWKFRDKLEEWKEQCLEIDNLNIKIEPFWEKENGK